MKATKYRRGYYGTARILGGDVTSQAPNVEQATGNGRDRACKNPTFDTLVDIRIVSHRTRLADADGISGKAAIDGLVLAGIIRDDSTKEVREVSYSQIKVKNKNEEKTVIQIRRVSDAK